MKDQLILRLKSVLPWYREHCRKPNINLPRISASVQMFLVQLAGVFSVLYGISYWSVPCALIIGGLSAIVAIEMQGRESNRESPEEVLAIQARIKTALASGEDPFAQPGVPLTQTWVAYAASLRRKQ